MMGLERVKGSEVTNDAGDGGDGYDPVYDNGHDPDEDSRASDDLSSDSTYVETAAVNEEESTGSDADEDDDEVEVRRSGRDHRSGEEELEDRSDTLRYDDGASEHTTGPTSDEPFESPDVAPSEDPTEPPRDVLDSADEYDGDRKTARRRNPCETTVEGG